MSNGDTIVEISFPKISAWEGVDLQAHAMGTLWISVATGLPIEDVAVCVACDRFLSSQNQMDERTKAKAFDFISEHDAMRLRAHAIIEDNRERSEADVLMLAMTVHSILEFKQSKEQAMKHTATEFSRAKNQYRDEPFKYLFARASKARVEDAWRKYEKVLHYSELVAHKVFDGIPGFTRPVSVAVNPLGTLKKLRERDLVRSAFILKVV